MTQPASIDARQLVDCLASDHCREKGWLACAELEIAMRRIDFLALSVWHNKVVAYEIKVARSDWLAELKQPRKRLPAWEHSTEAWFAAPAGIIKREEVPEGWGLKEFSPALRARAVIEPELRPANKLSPALVARMLDRVWSPVPTALRASILLDGQAITAADLDAMLEERYGRRITEAQSRIDKRVAYRVADKVRELWGAAEWAQKTDGAPAWLNIMRHQIDRLEKLAGLGEEAR